MLPVTSLISEVRNTRKFVIYLLVIIRPLQVLVKFELIELHPGFDAFAPPRSLDDANRIHI